jgi:pimeloyl-ACP methyl ester carboxylesterase
VAQEIALIRPALVRRLVLAATGPKGAPGMHGWRDDIAVAARLEQSTAESLLHIFFAPTETSRALGAEFLGRFMARAENRDSRRASPRATPNTTRSSSGVSPTTARCSA